MAADSSAPPMDVSKYLAEKSAAQPVAAPPMDVAKYLAEKSQPTQKSESKIGELAGRFAEDLIRPVKAVGTAVDYLDAPIRQAAIAPAKMMAGDGVAGPLLDIPLQLVKGPSEAPSWKDVYKKYGVSDKPVRMSNLQNAHPELGGLPEGMFDEGDMINTPSAAASLGFATELAAGGAGLRGVMKVPGLVGKGASAVNAAMIAKLGDGLEHTPIKNLDSVVQSLKELGITDVPKAVLTDNKLFQELESGLSQSGSLPARTTNKQYKAFFDQVDAAKKKIAELRSADSDHGIGKEIQTGLVGEVKAKKAPISELYDNFNKDLTKIDVNEPVVNRIFGGLKRDPLFQTSDGAALLDEYKNATLKQGNLASLKELRQAVRGAADAGASDNTQRRLTKIAEALTGVRDNSIHALKSEYPKEMHGEIDSLLNEIALADAGHSTNIKDVNSVKAIAGNKQFNSPSEFINKVNSMNEAEIAKKATTLDVGTLQNMKDKFPQVYEKVKTARINDLVDRSSPGGKFNENTFLKQYEALDPEMKELIFTPEQRSHIENFKTVKSAIPEKLGPSGTPKGQMTMEMVNPKRNALDYFTKKALEKSIAPNQAVSETPSKLADILPLTRIQGASQAAAKAEAPAPLRLVADKKDQAPQKGPAKWANDGFDKLIEHSDEELKNQLKDKKSDLLKDPKINELLQQASDLKPGTKAMDNIANKIKSRVSREQN